MFYLGSIAGILPYLLALSLTLVWGGHASIPFFASGSTPETKIEITKEESTPTENLKSCAFEKQVIAAKIAVFLIPFDSLIKVFNVYLFRLYDFPKLGISLLRAPPVFLF